MYISQLPCTSKLTRCSQSSICGFLKGNPSDPLSSSVRSLSIRDMSYLRIKRLVYISRQLNALTLRNNIYEKVEYTTPIYSTLTHRPSFVVARLWHKRQRSILYSRDKEGWSTLSSSVSIIADRVAGS